MMYANSADVVMLVLQSYNGVEYSTSMKLYKFYSRMIILHLGYLFVWNLVRVVHGRLLLHMILLQSHWNSTGSLQLIGFSYDDGRFLLSARYLRVPEHPVPLDGL